MEEKLSLLAELIKLAKVDKKERQEEYDFLLSIAEMLEIDKEIFDSLFTSYVEFVPPKLEVDRILQFQRLVLLANVDLEVASSELQMLRNSGLRLGLDTQAIRLVLKEMIHYEGGNIPSDRLIEIFKTYHN